MADLQWKKKYAVGVASIDDEHQEMFAAVRALEAAMNRKADAAEMGELLKTLAAATVRHFADEEAVMREAKYPGIGLHAANHQRLLEKIDAFVARHVQNTAALNVHALNFLRDWLVIHVENDDARLGEWLKDRAREQAPDPKKAPALDRSA